MGDGWFYVEKIGDESHQYFLGYCSWGLGDELEIWVHIDGYDYGFDYGRSDGQLSDEGLRKMREWCAKVCERERDAQVQAMAQAQMTIREDGSRWVLGCKDVALELDLTEHRLDMEEIYGRAMELYGCKMRMWERLVSEAQEQALKLVEETRRRVREELGEEPMGQGGAVSGGLRSPNVQRSPVKREREEEELEEASAGAHAYPFMGINVSRTSVASAKPEPEPQGKAETETETETDADADADADTETETDT